ncbi:MAG: hypothetical protein L7U72_12440 [Rubripirellula sp.]|nr:hypothetical protein [Rubripirellula sp.]
MPNTQVAGTQAASGQNANSQNVLGSGLVFIVLGGNRSASSLLGEESNG